MTYDEIVKGLECCTRDSNCSECPYSAMSADCFSLEKDAIELIKKQNEEIEELKEKNNGLALGLLYEVVNEDENLRKEIARVAEVKAVKEFAERVKEKIIPVIVRGDYHELTIVIDDLVDKMIKE